MLTTELDLVDVQMGACKKTGITVNGLNGLDIAVYRYLWLPICPNRYVHLKMDIRVVGISVPI